MGLQNLNYSKEGSVLIFFLARAHLFRWGRAVQTPFEKNDNHGFGRKLALEFFYRHEWVRNFFKLAIEHFDITYFKAVDEES